MAATRWPGQLLCNHCSYSRLFKGFIVLAITVAGTVVLYNGNYSRASSRAYELDTHSSYGGQQSYANTEPKNKSEERTQKRVNHIVQKLKHLDTGTRTRDLPQEPEEDWLMGTSDPAQDGQHGKVSNSKMTLSGVQVRSSSDLDEPEEELIPSVASGLKSFQPPRPYVPAVQYNQQPQTMQNPKAQTVRPPVQVNTTHSVVDHFVTTTCNKSCRWWREQDSRQRRVRETCSDLKNTQTRPALNFNLNPQTLQSLSHLLVLDSHKLIYCYIPKVGCTNWKRILLVAKGIYPSAKEIGQKMTHVQTDKHMRLLSSYPITEAKRMLNEYQKFMFVRQPFERIVSAYIDKFEMDYPSSTKFRRETAPSILQYAEESFKKNPRKMKDGTLYVTFQQFVRFVGDPKNRVLEPHWAEMYGQCHPCMIHYDILGKYSSLMEDANVVIETARLDQEYPASTNPTGSSERMLHYFSQLTSAEIQLLHKRYAIDLRLFGYNVPGGIHV